MLFNLGLAAIGVAGAALLVLIGTRIRLVILVMAFFIALGVLLIVLSATRGKGDSEELEELRDSGGSILFLRDGQLWRMESDGSSATRVATPPQGARICAFRPDPANEGVAALLEFGDFEPVDLLAGCRKAASLVEINLPSGAITSLAEAEPDEDFFGPRWSPDSHSIAYSVFAAEKPQTTTRLLGLETGKVDEIEGSFFHWSPAGYGYLPFSERGTFAYSTVRDPIARDFVWDLMVKLPDQPLESIYSSQNETIQRLMWAPDGRSILFHEGFINDFRVRLVEIETGQVTDLSPGRNNVAVAWSPDGTEILLLKDLSLRVWSEYEPLQSLGYWVLDLREARERQLIRFFASEYSSLSAAELSSLDLSLPVFSSGSWSPDGEFLAFHGSKGGIAVVSQDGTIMRRLTSDNDCCAFWIDKDWD